MIRTILADDHAVLREGIKALLSSAPDIEVVAEAANGISALKEIGVHGPDLVVADIEMPEMDGIELARQIQDAGMDTAVLILSMHDDSNFVRAALEVGALGYVLKDTAADQLVTAIRTVAKGKSYIGISPNSRTLAKALSNKAQTVDALSGRERDVLELVALGYTSNEIGKRLKISDKTVGTYRTRLLEKLGLENRAEMVQYALIRGIITPERARREMTRRTEDGD